MDVRRDAVEMGRQNLSVRRQWGDGKRRYSVLSVSATVCLAPSEIKTKNIISPFTNPGIDVLE